MCENSWICEFLCAISKRMHLDWFDTYDPWHELFSGFYIFVGNLWSVYFFCYEKEINCMELFIRLKKKWLYNEKITRYYLSLNANLWKFAKKITLIIKKNRLQNRENCQLEDLRFIQIRKLNKAKTNRELRNDSVNDAANDRDEVECVPWVFEVVLNTETDNFQNGFDRKQWRENDIYGAHYFFETFFLTMRLNLESKKNSRKIEFSIWI